MINTWLDLPAIPLFAALILFYGITAATIFWLVFQSPLRAHIQSLTGTVDSSFGPVSVLFALLTGFLAADISDRNHQAVRAVQSEASAAGTLYAVSIAAAPNMATIRAGLRDYLQSAITDEWPRMSTNGGTSKTDTALSILMAELSHPRIATDAGQAVHTVLLSSVLRLRDARANRLALASDRTNDIKWATVLILGVMTQAAIAMVHLKRSRPQLAAVLIFSVAMVVALGLIGLQEHPFDGAFRIPPTPLQEVLSYMAE